MIFFGISTILRAFSHQFSFGTPSERHRNTSESIGKYKSFSSIRALLKFRFCICGK